MRNVSQATSHNDVGFCIRGPKSAREGWDKLIWSSSKSEPMLSSLFAVASVGLLCLAPEVQGLKLSLGKEVDKSLVENAAKVNEIEINAKDVFMAKSITFPHGETYTR